MSIETTFNKLSARVKASLIRKLLQNRYEQMADGGLFLPKERIALRGVFSLSCNGGPVSLHPNTVVREGRNHMLNVVLHNESQITDWYMALFSGDVTPQGDTWTAANFAAVATEITDYDEADRPSFLVGDAIDGVSSNLTNEAAYTMNEVGSVYGGAIISSSEKGGSTGILLAAARFQNKRDYEPTDNLNVGYEIGLTST
ncbi:MAG: hypothetical protein V4607_02040 [Pseudomonadota bacterium]